MCSSVGIYVFLLWLCLNLEELQDYMPEILKKIKFKLTKVVELLICILEIYVFDWRNYKWHANIHGQVFIAIRSYILSIYSD
jgi:hypothetical protein